MLLKSSQATTLVDLQAELNAMSLDPGDVLVNEKVSPTTGQGGDTSWTLDQYFA